MSFKGEYSGARIKSAKLYTITKEEHPRLFRLAKGESSVKFVMEKMKLEYPLKTKPSYHGGGGIVALTDGRIFREGNDEDCLILKQHDEKRIDLYIIKGENLQNLSDIGIVSGELIAMTTTLFPIGLDSHAKKSSW